METQEAELFIFVFVCVRACEILHGKQVGEPPFEN